MPAFSSDDDVCPFPSRTTQLGTIGALRMRVGLRPDGLEDSPSRALPERRARKRRVSGSRLLGSSDELLEENDGSIGAGERGKLATEDGQRDSAPACTHDEGSAEATGDNGGGSSHPRHPPPKRQL